MNKKKFRRLNAVFLLGFYFKILGFISVIYTPSQDPLPYVCDPPPAYDTVVSLVLYPRGQQGGGEGSTAEDSDAENGQSVMVLPPKYDDVTKPIPPYHDAILS